MAYRYKCGYIKDRLYLIRNHRGSHSRSTRGLKGRLKRIDEHEKILIHTVSNISMKKKAKKYYLDLIKKKYTLRRKSETKRFGG